MADNELKVKISGQDDLSPVMQKAIDNMANLHTETINLNQGLDLLEKGVDIAKEGFEILKEAIGKSVEEALAAEQAQARLSGALIATGKYTAETVQDLKEYTEQLEKNTGANGESVKGMIATGLQLGLTIDKAKQMEQAARQLAAATGGTVEEAFSKLQSSLAGNARALGMAIPQIKDLGSAQLKTGEAIDIVIKSTQAQYEQYQSSLPAAIAKATGAYNDLYKAFGQAITASPALQAAISNIATTFRDFGDFITKNKAQITDFTNNGVIAAVDALQLLQNTIDVLYRTGSAAFNSLAAVINASFAAVSLGLSKVLEGLSYLPGAAGKAAKEGAEAIHGMYEVTWAAAKQNAETVVDAVNNQTTASKILTGAIESTKEAAISAVKAHTDNAAAMNKAAQAASDAAEAQLKLGKSFGGIEIGTRETRLQLQAQAQDYKSSLTDFQTYYDSKIQIAVTKEAFQASEIAKVRAAALKSTGGSTAASSGADAEVAAETVKQQQLAAQRNIGIINEQQYEAALTASQQAQSQQRLTAALAQEQARADALGETPAAYQLKLQIDEQRYQLDQQIKLQRARQEGANQVQLDQEAEQAKREHQVEMQNLDAAYYENQAKLDTQLGNKWQATLDQMAAAKKKNNSSLAGLDALLHSTQVATLSSTLGTISSLQNSHMRATFEIGKQAAAAQAIINIAQGVTQALSMGPILGPILATLVVAAGAVQVATIESQQFNPGGQADEGMDSVPSALAGKSFVLSAGERVVQPEANAKLTAFLDQHVGNGTGLNGKPAIGGAGGPTTVNITVAPGVTQADADQAVNSMITALRKASERGQPIISDKGIVYNNTR